MLHYAKIKLRLRRKIYHVTCFNRIACRNNIDDYIQLYEEPTDESIIQAVLSEEGIKDKIASDDDDKEEEEIVSITYNNKEGKKSI